MGKVKTWFESKMKEFKNDPDFLHEYISLLDEEICFVKNQNLDLIRMHREFKNKVKDRFKYIINGKGSVIPRIAIKIAVDDIFSPGGSEGEGD